MSLFDFFKFKKQNKYNSVFENDEIKNELNIILEEKINKDLFYKKELLKDIFIAIYKESPLTFDEFKYRLNNIKEITIDYCESNVDGKYQDLEKKVILNKKFFIDGPIKDFLGNVVLDTKESIKYNEYCILRTMIHESLHAISFNDFIDSKNPNNSLVILDELKTIQLEATIFNKYFKNFYEQNKKIYDKTIAEIEFYSGKETNDSNFYIVPNNLNFKGYKIINNSASYIDLIDTNFIDVYWNKISVNDTSLSEAIFKEFSKKAHIFTESVINSGYRLDNKAFYDYQKAFYKCIDYQIKTGVLDKEKYLDLKECIINNRFEFPKKEFYNGTYIKNYEDSLNFDIFYLKKIEEENYNILNINDNYPFNIINKIEKHFNEQSYDTNIDSSMYIKTSFIK